MPKVKAQQIALGTNPQARLEPVRKQVTPEVKA